MPVDMRCGVLRTCHFAGKLLRWTKDFDASGAVGEDVVKLLHQAFERSGVSECLCVYLQGCMYGGGAHVTAWNRVGDSSNHVAID